MAQPEKLPWGAEKSQGKNHGCCFVVLCGEKIVILS